MEKTPVVVGLQGENTALPQSLLPPNVAQYGLDNDYFYGTAHKRHGFAMTNNKRGTFGSSFARCLLQIPSSYFVWSDGTSTYITSGFMDSASAIRTITGVGAQSFADWDHAYIDSAYVVTGPLSNYRLIGSNAYDLCPAQFNESGVLASGSGAGAFNGTYLYKFAWRSSTDGTESPLSDAVTCVATNDAQLDVSVLPTTAPTNSGTDRIRIYRTIAGGTIYYYLTDHTVGTSTYTDTTTDANLQLNARMDEYRGVAPDDPRSCFVWQDRLWFCYADALLYTEATTGDLTIDSMAVWSRFYAENYIAISANQFGNLVKGVPLSSTQTLLFRANAIELLSGVGPSSYSVFPLVTGNGSYFTNTISNSPYGVFFANDASIFLVSGDGSIADIASDKIGLTPSTLQRTYDMRGVWLDNAGCYVISFCTAAQGVALSNANASDPRRNSFAYYPKTGQWARWSIGFDTMCTENYYNSKTVLATFRGRDVRFWPRQDGSISSQYIDGPTSGVSPGTLTGTTTGGTTTSLIDSGAAFTDHIIGCNVLIVNPNGTQNRCYITARTSGTELAVSPAYTNTVGSTYYVGNIDWIYRTPAVSLSGDRSSIDTAKRIWAFFRSPQSGVDVTMKHYADSVLQGTHVLDASVRTSSPENTMINARGREHYFEFSNPYPNQAVDLEGYQIGFIPESRLNNGN